jgi:hypothetical protein
MAPSMVPEHPAGDEIAKHGSSAATVQHYAAFCGRLGRRLTDRPRHPGTPPEAGSVVIDDFPSGLRGPLTVR